MSTAEEYVLGYSEEEYQRLKMQARFMRPYTEKYLRAAGVGQAMSVLDVGAGVGDVSLLAADLVGSAGRVLGIDVDGQALAFARERAREARCETWVEFAESKLDEFSSNVQFDALIGRFILLYLPDPAATIRHLLKFVRPGGIIVFHEIDFAVSNTSSPPSEFWDSAMELIPETFRKAGFPPDFGRRLGSCLAEAGLPFPTMLADRAVGGGKGSYLYPWVAYTLASVAPRLDALGIPEPDFPTDASLIPELEAAVTKSNSQITGPTLFGAWTRKPG